MTYDAIFSYQLARHPNEVKSSPEIICVPTGTWDLGADQQRSHGFDRCRKFIAQMRLGKYDISHPQLSDHPGKWHYIDETIEIMLPTVINNMDRKHIRTMLYNSRRSDRRRRGNDVLIEDGSGRLLRRYTDRADWMWHEDYLDGRPRHR